MKPIKKKKTKTITATVVYPVYVTVDIPVKEYLDDEEIREMILDEADRLFDSSSITPLIHECSNEDLID